VDEHTSAEPHASTGSIAPLLQSARLAGRVVSQHHTMSAVHTPQQKKRLAYKRDHYAKGKYDKAFRKGWPTKKRKASRSFRHAADALTKAASLDAESDANTTAIRQTPLGKWRVPSLRERVANKLARRVRSIGAKKARRRSHERRLTNGG